VTTLLHLYHGLPIPLRSAAATLRGLYLRWWRYGPESERLVQEALERDAWSPDQWRTWQRERLPYVLHRAATRVPYYREQWAGRRRRGDRASWDYLENWPVLDKEPLRQHPGAFVADDCDVRRMFREQTSGTTGKPLTLWRSRPTVSGLYALSVARTRLWNGVARHDRWAMLGGQLIVPAAQRRPPFWVWNAALHQLYMSSYHLAPDLIPHYLDALVRYRVRYLFGYTSSLYALAEAVLTCGRRDLAIAVAISNAEALPPHQRDVIAEAFRCPVRETYGMAETVAAASACAAGHLHQWPEVGEIEVLEDGQRVAPGVPGEFVCTGLLNLDMPLVRYRVGDRGRLAANRSGCACGRTLPLIAGVEGRTSDVLITRDGRRVFWLNPVFYGLAVRQGQIVQETLERIRIRYVPEASCTAADRHALVARLRSRMGDVQVVLEEVDALPRGANGKVGAVICQLSPDERADALRRSAAS